MRVVVPDGSVPDVVAARLLSGIAKLKGLILDRTLGASDGSLDNVDLVGAHSALAAGVLAVHKMETSESHTQGEVQQNVVINFTSDKTIVILYTVVWSSAKRCVLSLNKETLEGEPFPDDLSRRATPTNYITNTFTPLIGRLVELLSRQVQPSQYGTPMSGRVPCALVGPGADCILLQNQLNMVRRLSVWLPTKTFHDCTLEQFGAAMIALGGTRTKDRAFLEVVCPGGGLAPKFTELLDVMFHVQNLRGGLSGPHRSVGRASANSLYSLAEGGGGHESAPASVIALRRSPSSQMHSGSLTSPPATKKASGGSGVGSHNSKRSLLSFLGSGSKGAGSHREGSRPNSDVSLSAMNEDDQRLEDHEAPETYDYYANNNNNTAKEEESQEQTEDQFQEFY